MGEKSTHIFMTDGYGEMFNISNPDGETVCSNVLYGTAWGQL